MDVTPHISEDSGCLTNTSDFSCPNYYNCSLFGSQYVETPTLPSNFSRKRKLTQRFSTQTLDTNGRKPLGFLSSTLNESLSKSLEKCIIGNTPSYLDFTPIEMDCEQSSKRSKQEDSLEHDGHLPLRPKSAPTTPTKQLDFSSLDSPYKSESEPSDYKLSYKKKSFRKYTKLGSPERLELLYPNLKPITPIKLRTPEKLREFIKKINSPAKKRLFETQPTEKKVIKRVDTDPISVFLIKNDFRHIVSKIFRYLSEADLCNVIKVSKSWRRALNADFEAFPRYYLYSQTYKVNKENVTPVSVVERRNSMTSCEPDYFHRYRKVASQLTPTQSLQKCLQCMQPSVIEQSISQCQNPNCQYIYCIKCMSFSSSGPENFVDKCQTSELIIDTKTPKLQYNRISNFNELTSFLVNSSTDNLQSKHDSSGYLSESDFSPAQRSLSIFMDLKQYPVLQEVNRNTQYSTSFKKNRRSSLCSVISSSSTPRMDIVEPSSPPKIKAFACSKQSKKNLKRLNF